MVSLILIAVIFLGTSPVWGEQPRQMCLACHSAHYTERAGCQDCHRGNKSSDRKNIAHAGLISARYAFFSLADKPHVGIGNRLIDQFACRRCHVIRGRGNRLAANLDGAAVRRTPEELAGSIRRPVESMPDFGLNEEQATCLVNALLAGSREHTAAVDAPVAVHFTGSAQKGRDVFSNKCGSCHHLLSEHRGVLGRGNIGPNLSGLLSPHYPKTFRDTGPWTSQALKSWLKTPRAIQQWSRMRPIRLTGDETRELESILQVSPGPGR